MVFVFYLIAALLVAADQLIKWAISSELSYGGNLTVIPGFFDLVNWRNTGAAWGLFSDKTVVLSIFTGIACLILLYLMAAVKPKLLCVSLSLILGGALGNLIDRVRLGYVVDYLRFYVSQYEFPAFNLADSCIVIGCFLMIIFLLFVHKDGMELLKPNCLLRKTTRSLRRKKDAEPPAEGSKGEDPHV